MKCFNEYSGDAVFSCNKIGAVSIDLNNNNLDGTNYDGDDPKTNFDVRILV